VYLKHAIIKEVTEDIDKFDPQVDFTKDARPFQEFMHCTSF